MPLCSISTAHNTRADFILKQLLLDIGPLSANPMPFIHTPRYRHITYAISDERDGIELYTGEKSFWLGQLELQADWASIGPILDTDTMYLYSWFGSAATRHAS
ncbi:hypothetical protein HYQ45_010094 [Verticillium longisporum]|uniref:Uncharacterized protein n=1 Tax=Verticillium longisporum TaxID=100787 RepID=A0A8I3AP79_VERLO|nr:hypothetical protein HYQ45_010094 [Verticillium longisporum]